MDRRNPYQPITPPALPPSGNEPIEARLVRGNATESRHRVQVLVTDASGKVHAQWGDPSFRFFPRSAIKVIQALSWVAPGYHKDFGLNGEEMSIACGSHEGEEHHVAVVARWLEKIHLNEFSLECGAHEPYDRGAARRLAARGGDWSQLHNNCSGKHCGFLTACLKEGWPLASYVNYDHPVQARLRELQAPFFDLDFNRAAWGIDGCGIPTYEVTLQSMATAMARVADPRNLGADIQQGIAALNSSIAAHPQLIGGSETFSTKVTPETEGRVFAKVGAEGVFGLWIPGEGLGIAAKCEDGSIRGVEIAVNAVLRELGYPLSFYSPYVRRWSGEVVGEMICG
jgi:L-asparaginase II